MKPPSSMAGIDVSKYGHSPVHKAVASRDHAGLRKIISNLPKLRDPSEIRTESDSRAEEEKAEAISAAVDRRDVPGRDTALHLAVKLGDVAAAELLMSAGVDWSLQNEAGWSALQEAICCREEAVAAVIVRHYQPLAWAKWCRRLPRLVGAMRRMRDFYMEITFHFESSVIPFVSRIAPSDTYKIWKRGANLRADMTLAGFDGFRIQRSDQTILFLGDGSDEAKPGALCVVTHKEKEVVNALESAGAPASDEEVRKEVEAMSRTSIFRPGIDVTQAVLLPQVNWRRQERAESVGPWRAKVYDMHNVVVSIKSRPVPGAISDADLAAAAAEEEGSSEEEGLDGLLTEEEKRQLEAALKLDSSGFPPEEEDESRRRKEIPIESGGGSKKGWFGGWRKKEARPVTTATKNQVTAPPRSSLCVDEKVSDLLGDCSPEDQIRPGRHSVEIVRSDEHYRIGRDKSSSNNGGNRASSSSSSFGSENRNRDRGRESEYKKGLRPILWLSPNFPLQTEELLPLLDILANKVKAVRRLRELLTTKLPMGTFPVKVAIPVVPTIRVIVTFTKFEELGPVDEFSTPPSSPSTIVRDSPSATSTSSSGSSWLQWMKAPLNRSATSAAKIDTLQDPFLIPLDYTWVTPESKKKKMQEKEKSKSKKGKSQTQTQSQS